MCVGGDWSITGSFFSFFFKFGLVIVGWFVYYSASRVRFSASTRRTRATPSTKRPNAVSNTCTKSWLTSNGSCSNGTRRRLNSADPDPILLPPSRHPHPDPPLLPPPTATLTQKNMPLSCLQRQRFIVIFFLTCLSLPFSILPALSATLSLSPSLYLKNNKQKKRSSTMGNEISMKESTQFSTSDLRSLKMI